LQQATSNLNQQQHSLQQQHAQQAQHAQQLGDQVTHLREECAVLTQHKGVAESSAAAATQLAECAGAFQPSASSTDQSTNPSACCIIKRPINQSICLLHHHPTNQSIHQPLVQTLNQGGTRQAALERQDLS